MRVTASPAVKQQPFNSTSDLSQVTSQMSHPGVWLKQVYSDLNDFMNKIQSNLNLLSSNPDYMASGAPTKDQKLYEKARDLYKSINEKNYDRVAPDTIKEIAKTLLGMSDRALSQSLFTPSKRDEPKRQLKDIIDTITSSQAAQQNGKSL